MKFEKVLWRCFERFIDVTQMIRPWTQYDSNFYQISLVIPLRDWNSTHPELQVIFFLFIYITKFVYFCFLLYRLSKSNKSFLMFAFSFPLCFKLYIHIFSLLSILQFRQWNLAFLDTTSSRSQPTENLYQANQILPNLPGCRSAGKKTLSRRLRKPDQ